MFAAVPLFFAEMGDRLELLAMKCLTVVGGFVAGYVVGIFLGKAMDRWVWGETPAGLKKTFGIVLGLVVALIVALSIFKFGDGGGEGGGTGAGEGSGSASPTPTKESPAVAPKDEKPPPKVETVPTPEVKPEDVVIRVTFLGGRAVAGDKFYQLDDQRLTLAELKAAVTKRKADAGARKVFLQVEFPADPTTRPPADSPVVTDVTDWASRNAVQVTTPARP